AGVGHAEQADIGQYLELELELAMLAFFARRALARRAVGAGLEVQVAETALAAARDQLALAVAGQVGDQYAGIGVGNDGADRNAQFQVVAALAVAIRAAPVLAALGAEVARVAVVDQRIDIAVGNRIDAAAAAAVAAVRAAEGDELLTAKRGHAVAAVAGGHFDFRFVEEFHDVCMYLLGLETQKPYPRG